ncbi:MAG: HAMP domain-containing sensor histidine kinase [Clostridia bacterium]|nr:HAMP domain-containing sensor histidine kinase [Clostridia bacterium]
MTVKKRLAVSNIIMIIAPVCITALVGFLCLIAVYFTMHSSNGLGFSDKNKFYNTIQVASDAMYEVFEHGRENRRERLDIMSTLIDKNSMYMLVYENGKVFYESGNASLKDDSLMNAATDIETKAFVSDDNCQLYYYKADSGNDHYDLFLFNTASHTDNDSVKTVLIVSVVVVCFAILISILLTNRFLTKFVFKKIEEPLGILSKGVEEISNGNLDYRLEYETEDEFLPVCKNFNYMAGKLKQSVELLRKNEENRKELLLDISHDLRSPLTSIQAYVEGLSDGIANTPEKQKRYLETIKRKTVEIEKMVSSLLSYSKLEMEEFETDIRKINMASFLSEAVNSVWEEYHQRGLDITFEKKADVSSKIDEELYLRVISNLFENSLKYKNKPVGKMRVTLEEEEGTAKVSFEDDGPGVGEDQLEKLFEIFYRTDKARNNPGSGNGIGLAFVKKAVGIMNGKVRAEKSKLGGLSIIIITEEEK